MIHARCERCGDVLHPQALQCPRCGLLVHRERLDVLTQRAMEQEPFNRPLAAALWREAMDLLPAGSPQQQQVGQRIQWLGYHPDQFQKTAAARRSRFPIESEEQPPLGPPPPPDSWGRAIFKTGGSLLLNIPFYGLLMQNLPLFGQPGFAHGMLLGAGFLVLILIHEFGHVLAMKHYQLSASPPIFIPFLGALINLRQQPPNAKVEAIVGIGGPALGTIGAAACFALALWLRSTDLMVLAMLGFVINLFNMIPVPPMDGGRIMAAVSPWTWILGVAMLFGGVLVGALPVFLPILVLFMAMPRIIDTLGRGRRRSAYYQISRAATWTIGIAYVLLTAGLIVLLMLASSSLQPAMG